LLFYGDVPAGGQGVGQLVGGFEGVGGLQVNGRVIAQQQMDGVANGGAAVVAFDAFGDGDGGGIFQLIMGCLLEEAPVAHGCYLSLPLVYNDRTPAE